MSSLLLLNGSPRGSRSNSMKMLSRVAEGWERAGGAAPQVLHLAYGVDFARAVEAFGESDVVLLGTPLYTDSMPAIVKSYVEALAPYVGRSGNPRLAFLVQSGFQEALHSRPVERYFEKLARRLDCAYAGTIVRGGGEALQAMPDQANNRLWERLIGLGESLERDGRFDAEILALTARTERFSPPAAVAVKLALMIPGTQFYWNGQLKKNGAWDRRFAAPYSER
ncbi:MAG TPA: NAD(P)H-dependent oxidoreductase [Thermoleophilia bacterium]